jgi:hypothetical protein
VLKYGILDHAWCRKKVLDIGITIGISSTFTLVCIIQNECSEEEVHENGEVPMGSKKNSSNTQKETRQVQKIRRKLVKLLG